MALHRIIPALILRDLAAQGRLAAVGFIWSLLSPIGVVLLLSLAGSALSYTPPLGQSFPLFFCSGYLLLDLFLCMTSRLHTALSDARPLLSYPRLTWMDVCLTRAAHTALIQALVITVVLLSCLCAARVQLNSVDTPALFAAFFAAAGLGLAVGLFGAAARLYLPAWDRIWGIVTRVLFFASGVFFLPDALPEKIKFFLLFNPLTHLIARLRAALYPRYHMPEASLLFPILSALCLSAVALFALKMGHSRVLRR